MPAQFATLESDMHFRIARETWTPTELRRAQDAAPKPVNTERDYICAKIREHEAEIGRRAEQIRLLRLELDTRPAEVASDNRRAGRER
jgi:hypothetical protein